MSKSRRFVKLLAYLRPHWRPTALGIIALLVVNGLGAYIPLLIRDCVEKLSENFDYGQIIRYSILIISLSFFNVADQDGFSYLDLRCGKTGRI